MSTWSWWIAAGGSRVDGAPEYVDLVWADGPDAAASEAERVFDSPHVGNWAVMRLTDDQSAFLGLDLSGSVGDDGREEVR